MAGRPLKMPGHRPISRLEDRERPFSGAPRQSTPQRDPRLGPLARCLSRGRHGGARVGGVVPPARAAADAVAAREACQRRLQRVAQAHAMATQSWPEVRRELIDTLLHMRVLSLDVVETIEHWRKNGREGAVWPDPHTGDNYLLKMKDDTRWLADSPLGEILRFSSKSDPFFVVPSTGDAPQQPSNQMTPTLQAQRQQLHTAGGNGEQRRAVLPLQNSLLRRIRSAELCILQESVQARMQQQDGMFSVSPGADDGFMPGVVLTPPVPSVSAAAAAAASYNQQRHSPPRVPAPVALSPQPPATAVSSTPPSAAQSLQPVVEDGASAALRVPPKPSPPQPMQRETDAFAMFPVAATRSDIGEIFERFTARVDAKIAKSMETWASLQEALEDEGIGAPEWFWLMRRDGQDPAATLPSPESADGLAVFRLKKMSTTFGQLLHISVVDSAWVEDALEAVKARMFAWLPIKSIRATIWYNNATGEMQLNKDFEACFKKARFRWFQLCNSKGVRGQVMNCNRAEPPDPVTPPELFGIEVCLGQVWLRGCRASGGNLTTTRRSGTCAWNLVLASACLRHLWDRDAAAIAAAKENSAEARELALARDAAKEGLVRGLLSGDLEKLLSQYVPVRLQAEHERQQAMSAGGGGSSSSSSSGSSTKLAVSLAKALEAGAKRCRAVPGVLLDAAADAGDLVRRSVSSGGGYADGVVGLGLEGLPASLEALAPQEAVLGRLFVTLDWLGVTQLGGGAFEVLVHAAGACNRHPSPVFYVATSEDDTFVVIIPWVGAEVPAEEALFAACTEVLRTTQPMTTPPYQALRFDAPFDVRYAARTFEIPDSATQLELPAAPLPGDTNTGTVHLAEFSSLVVGPGRATPGRLCGNGVATTAAFAVQRPFAVCLFHTDIDDLNAPLSATLVS
mmetsp:Transcript_71448/g.201710  ORF Transcript_71448/g.201710 Transcript_71448/m.201710 type:complete len:909 (-) Transcript_71448:70-2796(-)